jgi:DNA (cytosine-5)-methyltransferase 1
MPQDHIKRQETFCINVTRNSGYTTPRAEDKPSHVVAAQDLKSSLLGGYPRAPTPKDHRRLQKVGNGINSSGATPYSKKKHSHVVTQDRIPQNSTNNGINATRAARCATPRNLTNPSSTPYAESKPSHAVIQARNYHVKRSTLRGQDFGLGVGVDKKPSFSQTFEEGDDEYQNLFANNDWEFLDKTVSSNQQSPQIHQPNRSPINSGGCRNCPDESTMPDPKKAKFDQSPKKLLLTQTIEGFCVSNPVSCPELKHARPWNLGIEKGDTCQTKSFELVGIVDWTKAGGRAVVGGVYKDMSRTFLGKEESERIRIVEYRKIWGDKDPDLVRLVRSEIQEISKSLLTGIHYKSHIPESGLCYEEIMKGKTLQTCAYWYEDEQPTSPSLKQWTYKKPRALDLFAGAGGMSKGLELEGFDVKYHVENNPVAAQTLNLNFPSSEVCEESVEQFLQNCTKRLNLYYPGPGYFFLVHASPPCQGWSTANRYGGKNDDANNELTKEFVKAIRLFLPGIGIMENVVGMLHNKGEKDKKKCLLRLMTDLILLGYQVRFCQVLASDYGDPQNRERLILFAAQKGIKLPAFPKPTHGEKPGLMKTVSVQDALRILEDVEPANDDGDSNVSHVVTVRGQGPHYRPIFVKDHRRTGTKLPGGKNREKEMCRLVADKPAPTVLKNNSMKHYKWERLLSTQECSLLQGFDLDYKFAGTQKEKRDQIGNAVPINLARALSRSAMASYIDLTGKPAPIRGRR